MTAFVPRPSAELSTDRHDPRDDWPDEARNLADRLTAIYGDRDPLPTIAGGWIARQKSVNTRCAYARNLLRWEAYTRAAGVHPLQAGLPLAEAFASHLKGVPAQVRVKGGYRGQTASAGAPLSDSTQALALSACSSFYAHAAEARLVAIDPFSGVTRPRPAEGVPHRVPVPKGLWRAVVARAREEGCRAGDVVEAALRSHLAVPAEAAPEPEGRPNSPR